MKRIVTGIQRRSREEYGELYRDAWIGLRIWIQEHGERALVVGLVLGVFVVLAPRLVLALLVLSLFAGWLVWFTAIPADEIARRSSSTPSPSSPRDGAGTSSTIVVSPDPLQSPGDASPSPPGSEGENIH